MSILLNCKLELDSVILAYLDRHNNKKNVNLTSDDKIHWKVPNEDKLDIQYYAFIVNNQFWICDPNNSRLVEKYGTLFSDYLELNSKALAQLSVVKSLHCKDFYKGSFEPFLPTNGFTNLDHTMCYWARICGVTQDTLIIFQVIDPKGELYHIGYEYLQKNNDTGVRHYFAGVKITPYLAEGQWTFQLIHRDNIIDTKRVYFKILQNDYNKDNAYFVNQNSYTIDIKY